MAQVKLDFDPYNLGWQQVKSLGLSGDFITQKINEGIRNWRSNPQLQNALQEFSDAQAEEEHKLTLQYGSACPLTRKSNVNTQGQVKTSELKTLSQQYFFDPSAMETMACQIDAIFIGTPTTEGHSGPSERTIRYVQRLKQIGSPSAAGFALSARALDVEGLAVAKAPRPSSSGSGCPSSEEIEKMRDPSQSCQYALQVKRSRNISTNASQVPGADLVHELFVGLFATNRLRRMMPNFSYIYGGFRCPAPVLGTPRKETDPETGETKNVVPVLSWCNPETEKGQEIRDLVPYVLYESILPSVSFHKYVESCSPSQFLSCMAHLSLALHIAAEEVGFTHYDLHDENVLLREVQGLDKFALAYRIEGTTFYIPSDRVATVIDYGNCHVSVDPEVLLERKKGISNRREFPKSFGHMQPWLVAYQQLMDRKFPAYDLYKLLMFLHRSSSNNKPVQEVISKLLSFFISDADISRLHGTQFDSRYALPYLDQTSDVSHFQFFKFLVQHFPDTATTEEGELQTLMCGDENACPGPGEWEARLGLREQVKPSTFFHIYDMNLAPSSLPDSSIYSGARETFIQQLETEVEKMNDKLGSIKTLNLSSLSLPSFQAMSAVRSSHEEAFEVANLVSEVERLLKVGSSVASKYQDSRLQLQLQSISQQLTSQRSKLCEMMQSLTDNYLEICQNFQQNSSQWNAAIARDSRLEWYRTSFHDIMALKQITCCSRYLPISVDESTPPPQIEESPSSKSLRFQSQDQIQQQSSNSEPPATRTTRYQSYNPVMTGVKTMPQEDSIFRSNSGIQQQNLQIPKSLEQAQIPEYQSYYFQYSEAPASYPRLPSFSSFNF